MSIGEKDLELYNKILFNLDENSNEYPIIKKLLKNEFSQLNYLEEKCQLIFKERKLDDLESLKNNNEEIHHELTNIKQLIDTATTDSLYLYELFAIMGTIISLRQDLLMKINSELYEDQLTLELKNNILEWESYLFNVLEAMRALKIN